MQKEITLKSNRIKELMKAILKSNHSDWFSSYVQPASSQPTDGYNNQDFYAMGWAIEKKYFSEKYKEKNY